VHPSLENAWRKGEEVQWRLANVSVIFDRYKARRFGTVASEPPASWDGARSADRIKAVRGTIMSKSSLSS